MIRIKGAWQIKQYPGLYITELENGEIRMFKASPERVLSEADIRIVWDDKHPLKLDGKPLPEHLYKTYGLVYAGKVLQFTKKNN